jgi:CDP-glucose 4,6-dehydratase
MSPLHHLKGRRVFVTGHTGFKGSWLVMMLNRLGAHVTGYSLAPPTQPSLFAVADVRELVTAHYQADVRNADQVAAAVHAAQPEIVFHLAAQSLVHRSYREPLNTFSTNVIGTASVLDAVRSLAGPCAVIVATSDKCYEPHDSGKPHDECATLGGRDPYSASKGAAELVTAAYRQSFFPPDRLTDHGVQVATVRAGNVIGGGDWAEDRIIHDIVRHLTAARPVPVRNPTAIRPWQHVLEPLQGYLTLADSMLAEPGAQWSTGWNFGPTPGNDLSVRDLTELFIDSWGSGTWVHTHDRRAPRETPVLRLSIDKALGKLAWRPRLSAHEAIRRTATWFRQFFDKPGSARLLCVADMVDYAAFASASEATNP